MDFNDLLRFVNTMGTYLQLAVTVWVGTLILKVIRQTDRQINNYGKSLDLAREAQRIERQEKQ